MTDKKSSPWMWIAGGCCLGLVLLGVVVLAVGGFAAFKVKEFAEIMTDPEKRERKALDVLHLNEAPLGYHGVMGLTVPFVFDMAILADRPTRSDDQDLDFDDRAFFYFKMIQLGDANTEIEDFFEGKSGDPAVLRDQGINISLEDRVARGELAQREDTYLWSTHRGSLNIDAKDHDGLTCLIQIKCAGDDKLRFGIWFGPEPPGLETVDGEQDGPSESVVSEAEAVEEPLDQPLAGIDFTGTVADPLAIETFLEHFDFCRG